MVAQEVQEELEELEEREEREEREVLEEQEEREVLEELERLDREILRILTNFRNDEGNTVPPSTPTLATFGTQTIPSADIVLASPTIIQINTTGDYLFGYTVSFLNAPSFTNIVTQFQFTSPGPPFTDFFASTTESLAASEPPPIISVSGQEIVSVTAGQQIQLSIFSNASVVYAGLIVFVTKQG